MGGQQQDEKEYEWYVLRRGERAPPVIRSIYVSPWGGPGGSNWMYHFPSGAMITKIDIYCGVVVDSIKFTTTDGTVSPKFGGNGGGLLTININSPSQRLIGISGTVGYFGSYLLVTSMRFHTNQGDYGPYGREKGEPFTMKMDGGDVVGFHGRAGLFIDAIGVYVQPTN